MNTLQQIIAFTGVSNSAGQRVGLPVRQPTMQTAVAMVSVLSLVQKNSMRALVQGLGALPSISLDADFQGDTLGDSPFQPDIRVNPSIGAVIETVMVYFHNGSPLPSFMDAPHPLVDGDAVLPGDVNAVRESFSDAGAYTAVIRRVGVTAAGLTTLEKRFDFAIRLAASPTQPPPNPYIPHPTPVTCSVQVYGQDPGSGGITNMQIFGGGFVSPEIVDLIDEHSGVVDSPMTDTLGTYSAVKGYLETTPPSEHTVQARGRTSGRTSNIAGFNI